MDGTALIYTANAFATNAAKTAHGLIRGTERYQIVGVLDTEHAGADAGALLDGRSREIPIWANLQEALEGLPDKPDFLIIGIASAGGKLDPEWFPLLRESLQAGISLVSGMHSFLADVPELVELAQKHACQLIDVRKPKPGAERAFWTGAIQDVKAAIVPVLGTDCAVGKRTTARMLREACDAAGIKSEMVYTGQTGWLQGGKYGFIFDSTLNDFVSGELEKAIVDCDKEVQPDVIFVEGQAALRNPSGPCGSEFLVSGGADAAVLVHPPARVFYKGWQHTGRKIPHLREEIALIRMYGVETLGIALNTQGLTDEKSKDWQQYFKEELGLPVVLPVEEGVDGLLPHIRALIRSKKS
ncbi:MAG: DUF1611 domain-containing protein, partial [Bacteroidota bacterium]